MAPTTAMLISSRWKRPLPSSPFHFPFHPFLRRDTAARASLSPASVIAASSTTTRRPCSTYSRASSSPSSSPSPSPSSPSKPLLRIAIVGGGAAGMSTALHLAPLAAAGWIHPVDLYEAREISSRSPPPRRRRGGRQTEPGSGAIGRDIGVGIWNTAWEPFRRRRPSHVTLLRDLEACGSYVRDVGYRTPDGTWLVRSALNDRPLGVRDLLREEGENRNKGHDEANRLDPALLFVREKDLLSCLRTAVFQEQSLGTVRYRTGVAVRGIDEALDGESGNLILEHATTTTTNTTTTTTTNTTNTTTTISPPYHLIVAADGLNSALRSRFAGHHSHNASTTGMDSAHDLVLDRDRDREFSSAAPSIEYQWEHTQGQLEATQVEDRKYVVFRGNAPKLDDVEEDGSGSFQTWGEERSMRFAAVPFRHACDDDGDADDNSGPSFRWSRKDDEEVWFATISDPVLDEDSMTTVEKRKEFLLRAFGSWHKPVRKLIASTPADEIMYETAVAHRYCASPVVDVAQILEFERWKKKQTRRKMRTTTTTTGGRNGDGNGNVNDNDNHNHNHNDDDDDDDDDEDDTSIRGPGPILVFVGDSCMTIDPVLAQGFTIAMEAGASLASSVETVVASSSTNHDRNNNDDNDDFNNDNNNHHNHHHHHHHPQPSHSIKHQTHKLRQELLHRHTLRERRLIQLLRSTELVQIMAQPHGRMGGFLARWLVRPMMKYCPEAVKTKVFHFVIRYSLGLTGNNDGGDGGRGRGRGRGR